MSGGDAFAAVKRHLHVIACRHRVWAWLGPRAAKYARHTPIPRVQSSQVRSALQLTPDLARSAVDLAIRFGFASIDRLNRHSFRGASREKNENEPVAGDRSTQANRLMMETMTDVTDFTSDFGNIRGAANGWIRLPLT